MKYKNIMSEFRHLSIIAIMLTLILRAGAQDPVSLDFCYNQISKTYPLIRQAALFDNSNKLKIKNLNKIHLPSLNVNGSATWQNEITQVSINLPSPFPKINTPVIPQDQYKLTLDINEAIYDGHLTSYQKKLEDYNLQVDQDNVAVTLYQLKDQINQFFFNLLLVRQNILLLEESKKQLESKLKEVESAVQNGAMLRMNADLIRAEIIKLDQNIVELSSDRRVSIRMLSELISFPMDDKTEFLKPEITISSTEYENKRLEFELFGIQKNRINLMKNMVTTKWNPRLLAFGQFGLGRPGYDFLSSDIAPMVMVGAKLTWNPWNWNANKNEKKIYDIQNDIIKNQQETFDKNLKISSQKDLGEIDKFASLIAGDEQIIDLRTKITKTASSQLDNGVITSADYITRLNEEMQSRLNLEIHKIKLIRAKVSYLFTLGKL